MSGSFSVIVRGMKGENTKINDIKTDYTIKEFRQIVSTKLGLSDSELLLIFAGKPLYSGNVSENLGDLGIKEGSLLSVVVRTPGGKLIEIKVALNSLKGEELKLNVLDDMKVSQLKEVIFLRN